MGKRFSNKFKLRVKYSTIYQLAQEGVFLFSKLTNGFPFLIDVN